MHVRVRMRTCVYKELLYIIINILNNNKNLYNNY